MMMYIDQIFSCLKLKQHIREAIEEERKSGTESLRDGKPIGMEEGMHPHIYT